MKPFLTIHLEISGVCNAKCPYCISGAGHQQKGGFIESELFKKILDRLLETGLAKKNYTVLALYNWGEPFLHPRINELINIINEYQLKYAFSTNASIIPTINEAFSKNLTLAIISMPGFSQESYDKIHGFDFIKIKSNIKQLVSALRKNGYSGEIRISYHVYQFNLEEIVSCNEFCKRLGINFFPMYATLLDWWQMLDYINNKMPVEKLKVISRDLFMRYVHEDVDENNPITNCDMINSYLIINEHGTVVTCCNLPNNHPDYSCGNLLKEDVNVILKEKTSKVVCQECMKLGIFSGPPPIPGFYYQLKR